MEILTPETCSSDLVKYYNWEKRITDFIPKECFPIDLQLSDKRLFSHSKIHRFQYELEGKLPNRIKEYFFYTLKQEKDNLKSLFYVGGDIHSLIFNPIKAKILEKVYKEYSYGNNPQISFIKKDILEYFDTIFNETIEGNVSGEKFEETKNFILRVFSDDGYTTELEPKFVYYQTALNDVAEYIFNSKIASEIVDLIQQVDFINYLETEATKFDGGDEIINDSSRKLKWLGTPAQFSFIIDLLINKGYLEKPTPFSERNARILLSMFEFAEHKPTTQSLGRILHREDDAIKNIDHKSKFMKIPNRTDLDK